MFCCSLVSDWSSLIVSSCVGEANTGLEEGIFQIITVSGKASNLKARCFPETSNFMSRAGE